MYRYQLYLCVYFYYVFKLVSIDTLFAPSNLKVSLLKNLKKNQKTYNKKKGERERKREKKKKPKTKLGEEYSGIQH